MDLTRQHPGDKVFVRAVGIAGITVAEETHSNSVILAPDSVLPGWAARKPEDITAETLEPVLGLDPEVVIIGTGAQQRFLAPELMMFFHERGIGIEIMNTQAACRTFNVLVMEERRVVAALLPPGAGG
ncbi:MAG: Mth938-like domain-containing protein [Xanthomonadales bacterium]|nr:Mth938-like domain-containing protein [Xanthomonadales bacterium]